jgi:hypothetical protein
MVILPTLFDRRLGRFSGDLKQVVVIQKLYLCSMSSDLAWTNIGSTKVRAGKFAKHVSGAAPNCSSRRLNETRGTRQLRNDQEGKQAHLHEIIVPDVLGLAFTIKVFANCTALCHAQALNLSR